MQRAAIARNTFRLTVIGGGAGGAETALAAAYRARTMQSPVHVQLLTGGVPILPGHGHRARSLMNAALVNNGVQVPTPSPSASNQAPFLPRANTPSPRMPR